uniref:PKD domain-containing protein n=1 Tax=Lacinutrix mariniflava TaxID=342955 RepID=UPI0006E299E0
MKHIITLLTIFISMHCFAQDVLMQNGTFSQCSGSFLDSGGASNYGNNEDFVVTICSPVAGEAVILNFSAFSTQMGLDIMTIYDGNDITAPVIGTYSGGGALNTPGTVVTSTSNTSGCLTIAFVSDAGISTTGWEASIECVLPCQDIVASIDSTDPVATGGVIAVLPGDVVTFNGSGTFSGDDSSATYTWDFGDGSPTETGLSVTHAYGIAGDYTVTFTVDDDNTLDCADTDTILLNILTPDVCIAAQPMCSDIVNVPSPAGGTSAEAGMDYGCLGSQPNPIWYFLQTGDVAGDLDFELTQNTGENGSGSGIDVDFIIWGPFTEPQCGATNLNASTQVDCSFSGSATEQILVTNATPNSYYMLLVTNYNGGAGYINMVPNPGSIDTNCDIICQADLGPDQTICSGDAFTISPNYNGTFNTFEWQLDGVTIAGETSSTITVSDSGTYTLLADGTDAVFGDPCSAQDDIIISFQADVTADVSAVSDSVCSGDDAVFTITGMASHIVDYNINGGGSLQTTLDAAGESVITITGITGTQTLTLESVSDASSTCSSVLSGTAQVTLNPSPTVVLTSNTTTCLGDDAVFTITGDSGDIVDYTINGGAVQQIVIDATGEGVVTISGVTMDQEILLSLVSNPTTLCSSVLTDAETVTIVASPVITGVTTNTDICSGSDAIFTISGTSGDVVDYNINGGATEQVTIDAAGEGVVTVIGAVINQEITLVSVANPVSTCSSDLTDTATVMVNANPTLVLTSNTSVCPGEDAIFTIIGTTGDIVDYNINGGGTLQTTLDAAGESVITIVAPTADQTMTLESINNPTTTCTSVLTDSNTVVINPLPTIIDPTPLEVCDDGTPDGITEIDLTLKNNEISGGNPAYAVTYYFTQADADGQVNPLVSPYTNVVPNMQTIYVGVQDTNTGCYDTTSLDLVVEQAPVAFTPADLEYCDPDSDGFGEFMLSDTEAEITGGAPGLTVTYHETMADADNNVNALASPYNNIVVNTQTIYIRVESSTIATDCATFVDLILTVNPTPQITTAAVLTPLEVCDDNADGFASFNLPTKEPEILNLLDADATNDLDSTLYTITYYTSEANAEAPINAIATPNAYVNTTVDAQTIWVRVEDNATGCYKTVALDLIVNPLPVLVQPTALNLCDVNNPGDEVEAFNLEDANAEILDGQTGITLTYFSTQAGADSNDGAVEIFSPYSNTSNAQTVYVRATNNVTGCVSTITLDLRVNPLPSPIVSPMPLVACDDDNDGFFDMFDLESQSTIIENGEPNVSTQYYETQADAMSGTNPLASPYANIVEDLQTVYVVVTNDLTLCSTIVTLDLEVLPSPVVPIAIADYIICDDDNDGINQFDFDAVITPQIFTAGQTAADFTLSYHTTQALADSGNNPIVNTSNYTNVSNPQTIYIRLVSVANGCVTTGSFVIRVEFPPVIDTNYDNILTQCDDLDANYMEANDGFTFFDLTVEDIEITGVANVSWIVTYYETLAD